VSWEGVGEDTKSSYSACLREISQKASRKKGAVRSQKYDLAYVRMAHMRISRRGQWYNTTTTQCPRFLVYARAIKIHERLSKLPNIVYAPKSTARFSPFYAADFSWC
jgi:hypothetical protein